MPLQPHPGRSIPWISLPTRRPPYCCWKLGRITLIPPIFRTTSSSATHDLRKPKTRNTTGLRGTITEEQGEIHVAQGKVIGGGSSINGQAMQRGFPEDFDSWAALGNEEWSYAKVLPYFRKSEHDLDIQDDCHGTEGPMPVRRRQSGPWPAIQKAFHAACVQAGFGTTEDTNGPHPSGLGVSPSNNLDGMRMSTALTHLNPVRHCLNLTVRGRVFVRKIVLKDLKAVGVEAESGGEVFTVEADRVVLSAGAIKSPHLLMLSGIGPEDQLQRFGIPTVHECPRRRPEPLESPQRPDFLQGQRRHHPHC